MRNPRTKKFNFYASVYAIRINSLRGNESGLARLDDNKCYKNGDS